VGNSGVVYRGMNHTSANRGVAGTTGNILWGISSSSLLTHPKLLSKQGPAKGSSSVNRPTSHRPFRDLTRKNMKLFVATLLIMAVISADAASLKVKSRKGRTFWPFVAAPPAPLSTLAKLVLAKGALAAGVGACEHFYRTRV